MPIDRFDVPFLAAGIVLVVAAVWILALNFADRLNRVLALSLFLLGAGQGLRFAVDEPGLAAFGRLAPYFVVTTPLPLLYLAACYHERFAGGRLRKYALPTLVTLAGIAVAMVMFGRHRLLVVVGDVSEFLFIAGFATMAFALAWDAVRDVKKPWREHLVTLAVGFLFLPTALALHFLVPSLMDSTLGDVTASALGLIPALGAVALFVRLAADEEPAVRSAAKRGLAFLALAPLSVGIIVLVQWLAPRDAFVLTMTSVMNGWAIVFAVIVSYSVARHQVFGIDRRVKWTVNRGTLAGIFLATFALVTKLADSFAEQFVGQYSWILGGLAAAALGFAIAPLQRIASHVADKAMPGVTDSSAYESFRKVQVYQSALAAVWEDRRVGPAERERLERLRTKLGLTTRDANAVERDFARLAGIANI